MKRVLWVLVLLFTFPPAYAQHEHHGAMHQAATTAKLHVEDNGAGLLTVRVGPINLPANSDHMQVAQAPDQILEVPFDGWFTGYHPRLTNAQGETLAARMLHHVAFWNTERSDFLCPNKEEHIFGAGGEMNDWPAQPGIGYRVQKGERIRVTTMFHNPTATSYPDAYLKIQVEYRRAGEGQPLMSVYPAWFDVMECGNSGYDLSPGHNHTAGRFRLQYSGKLLGVGGHLHDYGRGLTLANLSRSETVAALRPETDSSGHLLKMPVVLFTDRGGYGLQKGEQIQVSADYENPTGKPLPDGAMGIVVGYFLPADGEDMTRLRRNPKPAGERAQ